MGRRGDTLGSMMVLSKGGRRGKRREKHKKKKIIGNFMFSVNRTKRQTLSREVSVISKNVIGNLY